MQKEYRGGTGESQATELAAGGVAGTGGGANDGWSQTDLPWLPPTVSAEERAALRRSIDAAAEQSRNEAHAANANDGWSQTEFGQLTFPLPSTSSTYEDRC